MAFLTAMFTRKFNDVVQLAIAKTPQELGEALASLPHGVRYGVACDLDKDGRAHRYDRPRECAYFASGHDHGVLVWRWRYIASYEEAGRLLSMVVSLGAPLTGDAATRIYAMATNRRVDWPIAALESRRVPLN